MPFVLLISACAHDGETAVITISERAPHDELNDIILPPAPNLVVPKLDIARDATGAPIESNIYRGYDYENYTKVESNDYKLRIYVNTLLSIINLENTRRAENREENKKWREEAKEKKDQATK